MNWRAPNGAFPAFLGRGWSFPPTFNRHTASVVMAGGDPDIKQSIWLVLSTSLGERIMLATFGCDLMSKVFTALNTTTANEICMLVRNAVIAWEPRVMVESVTATEVAELTGWLNITVTYVVRETNTRSNLVYPFSTLEATIPPPPG